MVLTKVVPYDAIGENRFKMIAISGGWGSRVMTQSAIIIEFFSTLTPSLSTDVISFSELRGRRIELRASFLSNNIQVTEQDGALHYISPEIIKKYWRP